MNHIGQCLTLSGTTVVSLRFWHQLTNVSSDWHVYLNYHRCHYLYFHYNDLYKCV